VADDERVSRRRDLRASHADRDRAVEFLQTSAVEGRLTTDELSDRVGRALRAQSLGDLDDLVVDLPPRLAPARKGAPAFRPSPLAGNGGRALSLLILLAAVALPTAGPGHLAVFVIWLGVMGVVRSIRRSDRRRYAAQRAQERAALLQPPADAAVWYPPSFDDRP
jgi:hypothetical protein